MTFVRKPGNFGGSRSVRKRLSTITVKRQRDIASERWITFSDASVISDSADRDRASILDLQTNERAIESPHVDDDRPMIRYVHWNRL